MEGQQYAQVILDMVNDGIDRPFQYYVPLPFRQQLKLGVQVLVPFRSRKVTAYIVGLGDKPVVDNPKEIMGINNQSPLMQPEFVELSYWLSRRFFSRWIEAIRLCLPPHGEKLKTKCEEIVLSTLDKDLLLHESEKMKRKAARQSSILEQIALSGKQGVPWVELQAVTGAKKNSLRSLVEKRLVQVKMVSPATSYRSWQEEEKGEELNLSAQQEWAFQAINKGFARKEKDFLLFGVTGSGKTEVYLRLAEEALLRGRTVLILVPEIALTPQMISQFRGRFWKEFVLLHSSLSSRERNNGWWRVKEGDARVVLGARSAVFAPLENIGLIVMDEEHENTFKQSESPRYLTRDVARWRARYHNALLVMGSATPSLETYKEVQENKVELIELSERISKRPLPSIQVVDMRREFHNKNISIFSRAMIKAMEESLSRNEQLILFLNRRGFAGFQLCRVCGLVMKCPYCDISLTYHAFPEHLQCHHCGFKRPPPQACPKCNSKYLRNFGLGTQKVENEVRNIFPRENLIRMDSDTTTEKGIHTKMWKDFQENKASILIGTQMIAKGLDFPGVTMVGVISADISLHLPDFRAGERTFQLLTQVAGRTGRGDKKGKVIIQTYTPWHYSIKAASEQSYDSFIQEEIKRRYELLYPPFAQLILLECSSTREREAEEVSEKLKNTMEPFFCSGEKNTKIELLGPFPAPLPKIRRYFRQQLLLKGPNLEKYAHVLREMVWSFRSQQGEHVRVKVDFDPFMML